MTDEDKNLIDEREKLKRILEEDKGEILYEEIALIPIEAIVETEKLKDEIERLKHLVYKDELTGVFNRRGFMERITPLFDDALWLKNNKDNRKGTEVKTISIAFFDADNFKHINDSFGHDTGDEVLKKIAATLQNNIRELDFVSRFGGEEFVLALAGADEEEAYKKADALRQMIHREAAFGAVSPTVSVGVASLSQSDADTADELVGYADRAMYEAKEKKGKNNTVRFSELNK